MSWAHRATGREIIDEPDSLTFEQTARVLQELAVVNRWIGCGAYRRWLRDAIIAAYRVVRRPVRVLDVGAGGGDIAAATSSRCRALGVPTAWTLVDFSHDVCRYAGERAPACVQVVRADVCRLPFAARTFDIVTCAAFLHHFSDRELAPILAALAGAGHQLIFNDLHRSRVAAVSIRLLTGMLSRSAAVRHDGPLSVRKGFRRSELEALLHQPGLDNADVRWRWPFRWVVRSPARTADS